jgi:structure-specific endonuclease subunit SLX1
MQSTLRRINEPCVYVMQSGRFAGRAYVGFSVDPAERVRRHNGEIVGGAAATRSGRPWTILLVISGFPSQVSALQFEHALQHPSSAARLRAAALAAVGTPEGGSPARGGRSPALSPAATIAVARVLVGVTPWHYMPLSAHFTSAEARVTWDLVVLAALLPARALRLRASEFVWRARARSRSGGRARALRAAAL